MSVEESPCRECAEYQDAMREIERLRAAIAAAPDLLAAVKKTVEVLGIRKDFAPLGAAVELAPMLLTAIAKAEGK